MPTSALQKDPKMMPILADTSMLPDKPSDAMKRAMVKPMPPRKAAPPRIGQVTPAGREAQPSFTVSQEAPKIPIGLPKNRAPRWPLLHWPARRAA